MEGVRSKASAGNREFFLKMQGGGKTPPAVAAKPKGPPVASKPDAAPEKTKEQLEQEEIRRKEKEAYQKQKEKLAQEEAEEKAALEKKRLAKEAREQKKKEEEEAQRRKAEEEAQAQQEQPQAEEEQQEQQEEQQDQEQQNSASSPAAAPASPTPAPVAAPAPAPSSSGGATTHRCVAILDYAAKDSSFSFKKGDAIFVISADLSAKTLKGVCNGEAGSFPGHFVENSADGKRCGDPSQHFKMGVRCVALGNYTARNAKELSFSQGDVIFVSILKGDVVQGVLKGKAGLVPRHLIADEDEMPPVDAPEAKSLVSRCIGIRAHYCNREGWLDFDRGDVIMVPKKTAGKTWKGVFKGNVGKLRPEFVMDTAEHTQEEIDAAIAQSTKPAAAQPTQAKKAAPSAAADPFNMPSMTAASDPFAPKDPFAAAGSDPFSPAPVASDPFAPAPVASDPFAPAPVVSDPFAPAPVTASDPFSPSTAAPPQQQQAKAHMFPSLDPHSFENVKPEAAAPIKMHAAPSALSKHK